jgi:hypothetical protein
MIVIFLTIILTEFLSVIGFVIFGSHARTCKYLIKHDLILSVRYVCLLEGSTNICYLFWDAFLIKINALLV